MTASISMYEDIFDDKGIVFFVIKTLGMQQFFYYKERVLELSNFASETRDRIAAFLPQ